MDRILSIGCCGAGKSTFARRMHKVTGLPGWVWPTQGQWKKRVRELLDSMNTIARGKK